MHDSIKFISPATTTTKTLNRLVVAVLVSSCVSATSSRRSPLQTEVPAPPPQVASIPAPLATQKAVGKPSTDLIPRALLFGNPERALPKISPDGKHLSWLAPKDGVLNVWVAPIDQPDRARPVTTDTKRPIYAYDWAYTNKHILYGQDVQGDENYHLFRVDLDGQTTDLTPGQGFRV